MSTLDNLLIEKVYSPLSGWLQHRFGLGQWRLSIECLNGSIVFYIAGVALAVADMELADGIFITLLRALGWLLIMDAVRRHAYRQAASSIGVQSARLREWLFRLALVAVLPVSLCYIKGWSNVCYSTSLLLLISHLYFKASDTPPPQPKGRFAYNRA